MPAFLCIIISCGDKQSGKSSIDEFRSLDKEELKEQLNEVHNELRRDINNSALYYKRSRIHRALQDYNSAMQDVQRAIQISPKEDTYYQLRGTIHLHLGNQVKAEEDWIKSAQLGPENVEVRLRLAELFFYKQRYADAMQFVNQVLKLDLYNADAYFLKGMIHLTRSDTANAISSFQTAVEQNEMFLEAYFQLGLVHAMKKDKLAIEYYNNALRIKPKNIDVLYNKGLICQDLGEYNEALKTYSEILKVDPEFKHAHFNMGYVNMYYLKQYKQGAIHFTDAINIDPEFYQAYYNRGYCYELMGDVIRAKVDYQNALNIKPDYTIAAKGMERVTEY